MTRLILTVFIIAGLISCNRDKISQRDVDLLIDERIKSNEELLTEIQTFIKKYGREGLEFQNDVVRDFTKKHGQVVTFLDSLGEIEEDKRSNATNEFIKNTFEKYSLKFPYKTSITDDTPLSLTKLQIVNVENIYLREWSEGVTFRFNSFMAAIIPDKIGFKPGEKITGTVGFMAYSDAFKLKVRINNSDVDVKDGLGHFSIEHGDIKDGREIIKAEIVFPDTIYTTTVLVNRVQ